MNNPPTPTPVPPADQSPLAILSFIPNQTKQSLIADLPLPDIMALRKTNREWRDRLAASNGPFWEKIYRREFLGLPMSDSAPPPLANQAARAALWTRIEATNVSDSDLDFVVAHATAMTTAARTTLGVNPRWDYYYYAETATYDALCQQQATAPTPNRWFEAVRARWRLMVHQEKLFLVMTRSHYAEQRIKPHSMLVPPTAMGGDTTSKGWTLIEDPTDVNLYPARWWEVGRGGAIQAQTFDAFCLLPKRGDYVFMHRGWDRSINDLRRRLRDIGVVQELEAREEGLRRYAEDHPASGQAARRRRLQARRREVETSIRQLAVSFVSAVWFTPLARLFAVLSDTRASTPHVEPALDALAHLPNTIFLRRLGWTPSVQIAMPEHEYVLLHQLEVASDEAVSSMVDADSDDDEIFRSDHFGHQQDRRAVFDFGDDSEDYDLEYELDVDAADDTGDDAHFGDRTTDEINAIMMQKLTTESTTQLSASDPFRLMPSVEFRALAHRALRTAIWKHLISEMVSPENAPVFHLVSSRATFIQYSDPRLDAATSIVNNCWQVLEPFETPHSWLHRVLHDTTNVLDDDLDSAAIELRDRVLTTSASGTSSAVKIRILDPRNLRSTMVWLGQEPQVHSPVSRVLLDLFRMRPEQYETNLSRLPNRSKLACFPPLLVRIPNVDNVYATVCAKHTEAMCVTKETWTDLHDLVELMIVNHDTTGMKRQKHARQRLTATSTARAQPTGNLWRLIKTHADGSKEYIPG